MVRPEKRTLFGTKLMGRQNGAVGCIITFEVAMPEDALKPTCSHKSNAIAWSIYLVLCILTLLVLGWSVLVKGLVGVVIARARII